MPIEAAGFEEFFEALHGRPPFPWQVELARRVCTGNWPEVINLPTASGKTACLDIALYAMAVLGKDAPRRVFFVVDRRVVVNEAFERSKKVADKLARAEIGVLKAVADRLRELAGGEEDASPLAVVEMRGGIYRDRSWYKSPLQPTIVTSTVDQVGSRLLFRGYGVTAESWPIHAALVAKDSLVILDEAHCSQAFAQTLQALKRYGSWAAENTSSALQVVEMTATPTNSEAECFELLPRDREEAFLGKRIFASKPTALVVSKNRPKELEKLAEKLCEEAKRLAQGQQAKRVAILVNRVATARYVYESLKQDGCEVDLLIGRMRPIDRDRVVKERLGGLKSGEARTAGEPLRYVVATQCLEVGADLDFDVMVSECASLDALLQRFGRLNRLGEFPRSAGCIVAGSGQVEGKQEDPIYGAALADTWRWLNLIATDGSVEMAISSPDATGTVSEKLGALLPEERAKLRRVGKNAPILLPAHLDTWVQTSPQPAVEPSVSLFLHGEDKSADIQVVWREDLSEDDAGGDWHDEWQETIAMLPPTTMEALSVPISQFRRWFWRKEISDEECDLESISATEERPRGPDPEPRGRALVWRGRDSEPLLKKPAVLRPGDTVVLGGRSADGLGELGHRPAGSKVDCAEEALLEARKDRVLRLHPQLRTWEGDLPEDIQSDFGAGSIDFTKLRTGLEAELGQMLKQKKLSIELYPDGKGLVLIIRGQGASDDGDSDEKSQARGAIDLDQHLADVERQVSEWSGLFGLHAASAEWAARFHDYGKADPRFQILLRNGDEVAARFADKPLAKSKWIPMGKARRAQIQVQSKAPKGFRHELLSLLFAEAGQMGPDIDREVALQLIAGHHGKCRPLAPVVFDEKPGAVEFAGIAISEEARTLNPAHRLDSGVAERFWTLTRKHGWWGWSYLETVFRLADWQASEKPGKGDVQ